MTRIAIFIERPVIATEVVFALHGHVMMSNRIEQTQALKLIRSAVAEYGDVDAELPQMQAKVKASRSRADDGDPFLHAFPHRFWFMILIY
ncbi:hypothetical protein V5F88_13160 [Xanthobacter autotrophicus]